MDDLLREFLTETAENLAVLDRELVDLEQKPGDPELLDSVFRTFHTIKGTCGFLNLPRLGKVAHAAENMLSKFREGILKVTPESVTIILEVVDQIRMILSVLEATQVEPAGEDTGLIARLDAAASTERPSAQKQVPSAKEDAAHQALEVVGPASMVAQQSIRVSVDLLESMMTTVSELVLARNQLLQIMRTQHGNGLFTDTLQRLNLITSELQESVMKTRMQPIGNAWAPLPRLIRDTARDLRKKVELHVMGAETELDRQVLEMIKDPLTHMVRNAADHGLESPGERLQAGKPEIGKISLSAHHQGSNIIIEIADDGRGMQISKIKAKALQNELVTEAELAEMSDQQVLQFIFRPGFSTADAITSISGRGVGLDVVKSNLEKIGGTIEFSSQLGKGARFTLKIPLTLTIISALIVECGGKRFAIPQVSVTELVRTTSRSKVKIEFINDTPVLRRNDRLLPLISLRHALKLDGSDESIRTSLAGNTFIIVTQSRGSKFGIIVDQLFDTEEIVVKPMASVLRGLAMFSGNTILGDGSVALILDPSGIAVPGTAQAGEDGEAEDDAAAGKAHPSADSVQLLLFRTQGGAPKAVPLMLITRLEKIDLSQVEYANDRLVIQHKGRLMPLLSLNGEANPPASGSQQVLVFSDYDRIMGLMVKEVLDIVEEHLTVELVSEHPGLMGSAIIDGKATDVIDTGYYLTRAWKDWLVAAGQNDSAVETQPRRILLVDDSRFFRNLLTPILTIAGYYVRALESAKEALALYESGESFDLIISDIEMPGMNGFEFATAVRNSPRWADIPILGLSVHASDQDIRRGRQAGFTDHALKFDRDTLLRMLDRLLSRKAGTIEIGPPVRPEEGPPP